MKVSSTVERRQIGAAELRVEGGDDDTRIIRGYAAVFDATSQPLFGFREIIRKGAFKKTLRESDIRALWNHDPNFVLGRKSARTLRLEEDEKGLVARIFPPATTWASDLLTSIERGDVTQMSFGFRAIKDKWAPAGSDGLPVRELLEVALYDVSPVTFPAYTQTEVHVRALMESVLQRMQIGEIGKEERAAMAMALDNMRATLLEPGLPHSGGESLEPGSPHSATGKRTIQQLRERLLNLTK